MQNGLPPKFSSSLGSSTAAGIRGSSDFPGYRCWREPLRLLAPQPSAGREGDREGGVPGRLSLLFAFFPPCANTFQESQRKRKGKKTELPGCVPGRARAFRWARAGFAGAGCGAEAVRSLGSSRGPSSGARLQRLDVSSFSGSAVDLERSESEVGKIQNRTHILLSFVFGVLVCSLGAL